jgi:D-cysteine desulfhydrase family pyridoxal phosphate-dependent enzyme
MQSRIRFAHLPTPIEEMPRLSEILSGPKLFIKRDDQTGLAFGGNKTRKLEFLLGDAISKDAKTLVTAGAVQSNHCRQTAAAAAKFGLKCDLILTGEKPHHHSANLLLDELFGARIHWVSDRKDRESILQVTFEELESTRQSPYLVPYGGSNPTGALGYHYAMQEFIRQEKPMDWIVVASSSGGTQAGLTSGARAYQFDGNILGISIDEPEQILKEKVSNLASATYAMENEPVSFKARDILVNSDYCKSGYGVLTDLERNAIKQFAENEGLLIDPVYTGRAAGGMIDLLKKGYFKKSDRVLFWHTGGQPALFATDYTDTR